MIGNGRRIRSSSSNIGMRIDGIAGRQVTSGKGNERRMMHSGRMDRLRRINDCDLFLTIGCGVDALICTSRMNGGRCDYCCRFWRTLFSEGISVIAV